MTSPARICFIGNSHVASLKLAWDECGGDFPQVQATFFGARAHRMAQLVLQGTQLTSPRQKLRESLLATGGSEAIDSTVFDGFCLYGLSLTFPEIDRRLSSAVRRTVLRRQFQRSIAAHVLGLLRQVTDRPALVLAVPLTSVDNPDLLNIEKIADYDDMADDIEALVAEAGGQFVRQPAATRAERFGTLGGFAKGSMRLDDGNGSEEHDELDFNHMNASYGAIVLADLLPRFPAPAAA